MTELDDQNRLKNENIELRRELARSEEHLRAALEFCRLAAVKCALICSLADLPAIPTPQGPQYPIGAQGDPASIFRDYTES